MAKKALISYTEPRGVYGFRVVDVVESGNEYETSNNLEWKNCPDHVIADDYWYSMQYNQFKLSDIGSAKLPGNHNPIPDLAKDVDGNLLEEAEYDWENETWVRVTL